MFLKRKTIAIASDHRLNTNSEKDDLYVLSYLTEEEGYKQNISSWFPMDCDDNGFYKLVGYNVYDVSDLSLEIKTIVNELPINFLFMIGRDHAVFENNHGKKFSIQIINNNLTIDGKVMNSKKEALKYILGLRIIKRKR